MKFPMGPTRHDYSFPLRIGPAQRQAERVSYQEHVVQMIRQALLTTPGERVCLPEFGCGLRRLIFAPLSKELEATTELLVRQTLETYLAEHIKVRTVKVTETAGTPDGVLQILIEYTLLETLASQQVTLEMP